MTTAPPVQCCKYCGKPRAEICACMESFCARFRRLPKVVLVTYLAGLASVSGFEDVPESLDSLHEYFRELKAGGAPEPPFGEEAPECGVGRPDEDIDDECPQA